MSRLQYLQLLVPALARCQDPQRVATICRRYAFAWPDMLTYVLAYRHDNAANP